MYRHFVVVGPESARAAEAAECAGDQGKFFPYHDVLFENQGPENAGYITRERLARFAGQAGLDAGEFARCLDSRKYRDRVERLTREAHSIGVRGTPTVLVNGRVIQNPLDAGQLRRVILGELESG